MNLTVICIIFKFFFKTVYFLPLRYLSDEAFDCIICGENLIEEEIQFLACNNGHK